MKKGQALVIVLLVLGVVVTIGLSIASRSVTEVSVSTTQEESARALEAAEAGGEQVFGGIIAGSGGSGSLGAANASYTVSNSSMGNGPVYEIPFRMEDGEVATVYLNGYTGNQFKVCWGKGGNQDPAVEVTLYYSVSGITNVGKAGFDPLDQYGFAGATNGGCTGLSYDYSADIVLTVLGMPAGGTPLFARVRLYRTNSPVQMGVVAAAGANFPTQATDVVSVGQSGGTTQKLHAALLNWDLPIMFDAAIFSGGSLTK